MIVARSGQMLSMKLSEGTIADEEGLIEDRYVREAVRYLTSNY